MLSQGCLSPDSPREFGIVAGLVWARFGYTPATDQRHREIGRARAIVALITGQHDKTVGPMRSVEQE
jgi:hypothetical protein